MGRKNTIEKIIEIGIESECEPMFTEFTNQKDKKEFKCKCGNIFETTIRQFINENKRQCNDCSKNTEKTKWDYDLVKSFIENHSNCELISTEFKSVTDKMLLKCKCGELFYTSFQKFRTRNKRTCNSCSLVRCGDKHTTPKEDFLENLLIKRPRFYEEYKIVGDYKNMKTKIDVLHLECNKIWNVIPSDLLNNRNCGHCSSNNKITHRDFVMRMYNKFKCEYSVLSIVDGMHNHINVRHNDCGYIFRVTPHKILNETRCPKCANLNKGNHNKRDNKKFIEEAIKTHGDKFDYSLLKYENCKLPIEIICKKHNIKFTQTPENHLISKHCCPECEKEVVSGENNCNWNPNLTDEEREFGRKLKNENGMNQREWTKEIFKLDNYKCIICGNSGHLNAHHIKAWAKHKELRYEFDNGVTLCKKCHSQTSDTGFHKIYGTRSFTDIDFYNFYKERTGKEFNIEEIRNKDIS